MTGADAEPPAVRHSARLLLAGSDRSRLSGVAADLQALGYECLTEVIHEDLEIGAGWVAVVVDLRAWTTEGIAWCQRGRKEGWLGPVPVVKTMASLSCAVSETWMRWPLRNAPSPR